ncbi:YcxB family protein [Clostridium cibarium]|uniref:YcxB family protein n=1 Tax=Clostridium cibarium TaxID=2762247 RepID=A0ABR8PY98_9CLOT|nr:YcxB family protein [Clostridium cibarium]MBD7913144.1 YcxB family protein [Clostridium cibarium]
MIILITIVGGGILDLIAYYNLIEKEIRKLQKAGGYFCEHTIKMNEEGVREITSYNDTLSKWKAINSVTENKDYIYVIFSNSSFHVIPKRAFNSIEEANEFYDKSVILWKENRISGDL